MAEKEKSSGTLVIGLGRFGSAVAMTLNSLDREILAVESDPAQVERFSPLFPVVEADATRLDAMEQLGAKDFSSTVVGAVSYTHLTLPTILLV